MRGTGAQQNLKKMKREDLILLIRDLTRENRELRSNLRRAEDEACEGKHDAPINANDEIIQLLSALADNVEAIRNGILHESEWEKKDGSKG